MKRNLVRIAALALVLCLLAGCHIMGRGDFSNMIQNALDEYSSDGKDGAGDDSDSSSNSASLDYGAWPADLTGIVPEFIYGDVTIVSGMTETTGGVTYTIYNILLINVTEGGGDRYSSDLVSVGFNESKAPYLYDMPGTDKTVTTYAHNRYAFTCNDTACMIEVDHWVSNKGDGAVFISIPMEEVASASGADDSKGAPDRSDSGLWLSSGNPVKCVL